MRIAVMIAASALVAGCSSTAGDGAERSQTALTAHPTISKTSPTSTGRSTTTTAAAKPPQAGATITDVIGWIEQGTAADVAAHHTASRAGETTELGEDVAFTGPSGTPNCMTDARADGALACLVDLTDPPPQPADVYGQWKGGWVDFSGPSVEVGSAHGDPGRFSRGTGAELPPGQTLAFGDYRCRADTASVYCVNYAHQSAVKFDAAGIETFGCLRPATPPAGIGKQFSC
ncbi:hypothetical protein [Mycolicibacterium sp. YH-1]|uniref:hypothetical protein n=1 Tax=Mycolicibacterium sp. YH-1 TaxID=2908837 RepID=UPI001F4C27C0|nr:hypothetical protein [Mycolicibacterium sp. YH-1]UNB55329.1 hypothetical protein L0M16_13995 [Mycolicibacterium sp. YH-1]